MLSQATEVLGNDEYEDYDDLYAEDLEETTFVDEEDYIIEEFWGDDAGSFYTKIENLGTIYLTLDQLNRKEDKRLKVYTKVFSKSERGFVERLFE